jgi:hypothetical protein
MCRATIVFGNAKLVVTVQAKREKNARKGKVEAKEREG